MTQHIKRKTVILQNQAAVGPSERAKKDSNWTVRESGRSYNPERHVEGPFERGGTFRTQMDGPLNIVDKIEGQKRPSIFGHWNTTVRRSRKQDLY